MSIDKSKNYQDSEFQKMYKAMKKGGEGSGGSREGAGRPAGSGGKETSEGDKGTSISNLSSGDRTKMAGNLERAMTKLKESGVNTGKVGKEIENHISNLKSGKGDIDIDKLTNLQNKLVGSDSIFGQKDYMPQEGVNYSKLNSAANLIERATSVMSDNQDF